MMMTNKKRLAAVVSVILVMAFALMMTGCGSGGGGKAGGVVNAFFDSIDKHDVKKFFNCFEDDIAEEMLQYIDEDMMEEQLEMLDELLADEYGKNWRKKIKVGKAEEVDEDDDVTYYEVEVSMDGEDDVIEVIKVKNKYYIDDGAMGGLF